MRNQFSFHGLAWVSFCSAVKGNITTDFGSKTAAFLCLSMPLNLEKPSKAWMSLRLTAPKGLFVGILLIRCYVSLFYYCYTIFKVCGDMSQLVLNHHNRISPFTKNLSWELKTNSPINIKTYLEQKKKSKTKATKHRLMFLSRKKNQ